MENSLHSTWPPAYNLRISKKARNVHLKIIPNQGLEIVVPVKQQKRVVIADLLIEKKQWIQKHLAKLQIHEPELLNSLSLQAINQTWQIEYQKTTSKQIGYIIRPGDKHHTIVLYGATDDIPFTHKILKQWLKEVALQHLVPWLETLSIQHDLPFNKASVRAQQTLWGSCSAEKNISLNYKLLFLPPAYAEHILLHELCHTKYLNHSKRFWNLLAKLDTNWLAHDQAIREADQHVPPSLNFDFE